MAGAAVVLGFERRDGVDIVKCEVEGGVPVLADHFAPAGDDAPPLAGDFAGLVEGTGTGCDSAVGYDDSTPKRAVPGEKRIYARDAGGEVVAEIFLRANGDIEITSITTDGEIVLNGVRIDRAGNIHTPGDVSAGPQGVSLLTHVHSSSAPGSPTGPAVSPPPPEAP